MSSLPTAEEYSLGPAWPKDLEIFEPSHNHTYVEIKHTNVRYSYLTAFQTLIPRSHL